MSCDSFSSNEYFQIKSLCTKPLIFVVSEKSAPLVWGKAATLLLIDEYKKKSKIVDSGRMTKKTKWLEISKTLNDNGYLYNAEQVSGRWKTLNRAYKNVKDQNRKSGNSRKNIEFETSMDDMLGDDPAIEPLHIASSRKASTDKSITCSSKGESQEADDSEEESNDNVEMAASKWNCS